MYNYNPYFNSPETSDFPELEGQHMTEDYQTERLLPGLFGGPSQGGFFPPPGPGPGMGPGPGHPGQASQPPNSPPPNFTPKQAQAQPFAIDPGAIRGCLFRFTYVWLRRDAFWFFPVFVGRRSVSGFRWAGFRWVYYGIDLRHVQSFQCF